MDLVLLSFLAAPIAASLIIAGIHAYLGLHVVERGVIFVDLSLAQIADVATRLPDAVIRDDGGEQPARIATIVIGRLRECRAVALDASPPPMDGAKAASRMRAVFAGLAACDPPDLLIVSGGDTLIRLLAADGSIDPAFNGGKPFTYHSAQALNEGGRRITVGKDGSIMSAGYTNLGDALRNHVILIHLNADGTLDQDFGGFVSPHSSADAIGLVATPGVAVFNPFVGDQGFAECYAAVQLSDGSWVTTGYGGATGEGVQRRAEQAEDVAPSPAPEGVVGLQAVADEVAGRNRE